MTGNSMRQHITDHAFNTKESASYAFTLKGLTIGLDGGVRGYVRSLNTQLPDIPEAIPGKTTNTLNTNYFILYVTPKFEYWFKRVNMSLDAPLSFAHYRFDKSIANRNEVYFSPALSVNWKPNNRFSISVRGGLGRSPMNLNMILPGYVMTDYRSFRSGVDDFYNSTSKRVSATLSYKHTRHGIFANAFVMHSWNHIPYTMAQQLFGDYVVYSYSAAKNDGKTLMTSGSIGKTLDFIRGSLNLNGSFSRSESNMISENTDVNSVNNSWSVGFKINGAPLTWFSIDYRFDFSSTRLVMNGTKTSWLGDMENELLFNFIPHPKWEWHISGEHYRNELSDNKFKNVVLLDTKIVFKRGKRLEFSASLNNILNRKTYNYKTYNQLTSFESQRWLRGRQLMVSITIRK